MERNNFIRKSVVAALCMAVAASAIFLGETFGLFPGAAPSEQIASGDASFQPEPVEPVPLDPPAPRSKVKPLVAGVENSRVSGGGAEWSPADAGFTEYSFQRGGENYFVSEERFDAGGAEFSDRSSDMAAKREPSSTQTPSGVTGGLFNLFGLGGGASSGSGAGSTGGSSSPGMGGTSNPTPTVTVAAPFFAVSADGGISGVTFPNSYNVMAAAGAPLSAVHGTTSSGYQVWLNQGGQASSP